jgi:hypothetical protein
LSQLTSAAGSTLAGLRAFSFWTNALYSATVSAIVGPAVDWPDTDAGRSDATLAAPTEFGKSAGSGDDALDVGAGAATVGVA